jgi:hypothetical protein
MTRQAEKINDEIDRLCKEYDRLDELNNPADYAKMEDLKTEIADLKSQICENCEGTGWVWDNNYFRSNPYLIDRPEKPCSECGGSGVV